MFDGVIDWSIFFDHEYDYQKNICAQFPDKPTQECGWAEEDPVIEKRVFTFKTSRLVEDYPPLFAGESYYVKTGFTYSVEDTERVGIFTKFDLGGFEGPGRPFVTETDGAVSLLTAGAALAASLMLF